MTDLDHLLIPEVVITAKGMELLIGGVGEGASLKENQGTLTRSRGTPGCGAGTHSR